MKRKAREITNVFSLNLIWKLYKLLEVSKSLLKNLLQIIAIMTLRSHSFLFSVVHIYFKYVLFKSEFIPTDSSTTLIRKENEFEHLPRFKLINGRGVEPFARTCSSYNEFKNNYYLEEF